MKTIKGPAIFLAQFAGNVPPFNDLNAISRWAAALGYKGVQIPTWDSRLFDLKRAAASRAPTGTVSEATNPSTTKEPAPRPSGARPGA